MTDYRTRIRKSASGKVGSIGKRLEKPITRKLEAIQSKT